MLNAWPPPQRRGGVGGTTIPRQCDNAKCRCGGSRHLRQPRSAMEPIGQVLPVRQGNLRPDERQLGAYGHHLPRWRLRGLKELWDARPLDDRQGLPVAPDERRYRLMVLLAMFCGLRLGELLALRRDRMDLMHDRVRIVEQQREIRTAFSWAGSLTVSILRRRTFVSPSCCSGGNHQPVVHYRRRQMTMGILRRRTRLLGGEWCSERRWR